MPFHGRKIRTVQPTPKSYERLQEALVELTDGDTDDDTPVPDGGIVVSFFDEAWPQPTDNHRRLWAFGPPTIWKETPTEHFDDAVIGSTHSMARASSGVSRT